MIYRPQFLLPIPFPASSVCLFPIHFSSLQKRAGLLGISTKHSISIYRKTRHLLSYYVWMKQPSRGERGLKSKQKNQSQPHSHC